MCNICLQAIEIDRIKIFSLDTSLFYANAEHFQTTILESILAIDNNEIKLRHVKVVPREEENVRSLLMDIRIGPTESFLK